MMKRIIPFVDHEIGYMLLKRLISHSEAGLFEIPAVVTSCENGTTWWPGVGDLCAEAKIPLLIYEAKFLKKISMLEVDWFLLLSWKYILPPELIGFPIRGALNLHYSLLPSFRGVYPVNWAIIEGKSTTGITYHFVNEEIDGGDVFMQVEIPVRLSDTARTLQSRLDEVAYDYFDEFIERLLSFRSEKNCVNTGKKSNNTSGYYSRELFENICALDFDKKYRFIDLYNILRGLTFFHDSSNAYVINEETGKKIYINIELREEE